MSEASLTVIHDKDGSEICVMYRRWKYVEHGIELGNFLGCIAMVQGYTPETPKPFANGMNDFAAQVIAHFKSTLKTGLYLCPAGYRDFNVYAIYHVELNKDNELTLREELVYDNKPHLARELLAGEDGLDG